MEEEQHGAARAQYGTKLIKTIADRLSIEFGANYSERRLRDYRQFYLSFDDLPNWHSRVPNLTWTHFRRIMAVPHPDARRWYAEEASREMWSIRTLDRNIGTQYYGRLCAAKREGEQLPKAENIHVDDPKEYIKNPMVAFIISLMKFEFQSDFCNFVENSVDMGKDKITTDSGKQIEATAPVIISASRSTDIPAFYAKWFFNRLAKGYCVWYNPFNRKPMYVSFRHCKVVVFWTKNPEPILPYLYQLDERGIHYYFQVTLNDYVREGFEPNVPSVEKRIETFRKLSEQIGHERVIWRFDPLVITPDITPRILLNRIWKIGNRLKGYTDKLVFSFVDVKAYRKVQNNLIKETHCFTKENVETAELNEAQRLEIVEGLAKLRDVWKAEGWNLTLATCAEEDNLEKYDIDHNRCIDGELMERVFGEDKELVYYLHTGKLPEPDLLGEIPSIPIERKNLKDKGQRKICGCMVSKDIGMYDTCLHFCVYCYANTSRECVLRNKARHSDNNESLIK